jgi:hypothetical protein
MSRLAVRGAVTVMPGLTAIRAPTASLRADSWQNPPDTWHNIQHVLMILLDRRTRLGSLEGTRRCE